MQSVVMATFIVVAASWALIIICKKRMERDMSICFVYSLIVTIIFAMTVSSRVKIEQYNSAAYLLFTEYT